MISLIFKASIMDTYKTGAFNERKDGAGNRSFFNYFINKISGIVNQAVFKQKKRTPHKMPLTNTGNVNSIKVPFRKNL